MLAEWFTSDQFWRLLTLADYNTRVVLLGTAALGPACGVVGTFMLLRQRALISDALSHATLPGVALAFLVMTTLGYDGKALPNLLAGALIFGLIGVGGVLVIQHQTRLKADTALAIILSVFYGFGIVLLGIVQRLPSGHAAGLKSFIYGKTASMIWNDAVLIAVAAMVVGVLGLVLFKELKLLCFDSNFAGSQGWPTTGLDMLLLLLVTCVTVIGLQAVGLILIVALLIIPPAAARFWTDRLERMIGVSALIGLLSCLGGVAISALGPKLPTGPFIVIVAAGWFVLSMLLGPARGVLMRWRQQWTLSTRVARQNLLRASYELAESGQPSMTREMLDHKRAWMPGNLSRALRLALSEALLRENADGSLSLTERGQIEAERVVRNHRLWELFLINYADIAPSRVDRGADSVEHIIEPQILSELEKLLAAETAKPPASPHNVE
jgi:manganese/zinc/iron transport system permease protein